MDRISARTDHQSPPEISTRDWQIMENIIRDSEVFENVRFDDFEFRFVPMADQTYSALLSFKGIDVFHFMWTEVEGLVEITHRLVNPEFRRRGIATKVMEMIQERVQHLADSYQTRYSLSLETTQTEVVRMGLNVGMRITEGSQEHDLFRLSKAFLPETKAVQVNRSLIRSNILNILSLRVA